MAEPFRPAAGVALFRSEAVEEGRPQIREAEEEGEGRLGRSMVGAQPRSLRKARLQQLCSWVGVRTQEGISLLSVVQVPHRWTVAQERMRFQRMCAR